MSALRTLLAHNKGVGRIKLAGLAGALTLGDLLHSTITHQKPSLNVTKDVRGIQCVSQFIGIGGAGMGIEAGTLPSFKHSARILNALEAGQAVTLALDYWDKTRSDEIPKLIPDGWAWRDPGYHGQDVIPVSKQELIHARNDVQRSLLSLPPAISLLGREYLFYEVLRVAGLVYSDLVLFPLPAETGVRERYGRRMRDAMEHGVMDQALALDPELLLWCCIMGAAASAELDMKVEVGQDSKKAQNWEPKRELRDRMWFVSKVRICAKMANVGLSHGLKGWDEVRRVCVRYLWWGPVCDIVGLGMWEEVVGLQSALIKMEIVENEEENYSNKVRAIDAD